MSSIRLLTAGMVLVMAQALGQGTIHPFTGGARTHVGSIDGPLAGTNILGQLFVGHTPDTLAPLDGPYYHRNGLVVAGIIVVWGYPQGSTAYVQMWAWDWTVWGMTLDLVPPDQFGKTDIISVYLPGGTQWADTRFTQPAVVPLVPEPSVSMLGLLGVSLVWLRCRRLQVPVPPRRGAAFASTCGTPRGRLMNAVTRCYGSMTSFNVLFREKEDQF